jgi:hypothetical protein
LGCLLQTRGERGAIFMGCFQQQLHSGCLRARGESGIALSGASAKVKPLDRFQADRKCVGTSDVMINNDSKSDHDICILDFSPRPLGGISKLL